VGFVIDSTTGALSVVPGSPFATEAGPEQVAIDPPGRFLCVSDLSGPGISGFDINATTGVLTPITGSPFSSEESPDGLVVHSSGKFIYSALTYDNSIQALAIDQTTGALTEIHGSPFLLPPVEGFQANPYSIAQDPAGKFLYALASSNGRIYEFRLTPVPAS
jgi:6-phosphogluconolactonase (cycloisomerase 2 family)